MRPERILSRAILAALRGGLAGAIFGLLAPEDELRALHLSRELALYGPLAVAGVTAAALAALRALLASRRAGRPPPKG